MRSLVLLGLALAAIPTICSAGPPKRVIDLNSSRFSGLGIPLAEGKTATYRIVLTGEVGEKEEGRGTLVLDLTAPPAYDAFGFVTGGSTTSEVKLDCIFKFVQKTTKTYTVRVGGPGSDKYEQQKEEWSLYSITGPKITSRLFLALPANQAWGQGRFLVQDNDGKVKHAIDLTLPPQPEPCHPGCFPSGTPIQVPGGTSPIERICQGDTVTTIDADGKPGAAKVEKVFVTRNRLLEVRTTVGKLVTTETQPMAHAGGGFRSAGELKAGDRIWRWTGSKRQAEEVLGVFPTNRTAEVYNLVLGIPTTFIAGDFLVRSKPPVDVGVP